MEMQNQNLSKPETALKTGHPSALIVVTGATGLVGRALVLSLQQLGYPVTALVRNAEKARSLLPTSTRLATWDGLTPPPLEALTGARAVVHLAGESLAHWPWTHKRREALRASRLGPTSLLATALAEVEPTAQVESVSTTGSYLKEKSLPVLILASGMGYHGNVGNSPVTEDGPPGDDFLGTLARDWEAAALPAAKAGLRTVAMRFGMILAPQGGALPSLMRIYRLGLGARLGSGRQGQPWVHIDDAVGMILHAIETPSLQGPVHACAPETPSQLTFARTLASVLHRPALPWGLPWAPAPILKLALGGFSDLLLHGQYGSPIKLQESGYPWRYSRLDVALQDCASHT